jgi:hypothetical protein
MADLNAAAGNGLPYGAAKATKAAAPEATEAATAAPRRVADMPTYTYDAMARPRWP